MDAVDSREDADGQCGDPVFGKVYTNRQILGRGLSKYGAQEIL